jgi:hypothetical protein
MLKVNSDLLYNEAFKSHEISEAEQYWNIPEDTIFHSHHRENLKSYNPVYTTPSYLCKSISILCTPHVFIFLVAYFTLGFPTTIIPFLSYSRYMPANLNLHDLVILIIFDKEYRSRSSSLWICLHTPITSSLCSPNILLSIMLSK